MAFGCPILTSDLDFAREICGDAAIYFNPWSVDALYEAIIRLKSNPVLSVELRNCGRKNFLNNTCSWEQNAHTLRSIVTRLLASRIKVRVNRRLFGDSARRKIAKHLDFLKL